MQTTFSEEVKTGVFIKELKNRFLCEVEMNSERVVCYVPSSSHLGNYLNLYKKKVLLIPTSTPTARTPYALFAVPYKKNYIVLNTSMANHAIANSIQSRRFSFLGARKNVIKEHVVSGYKCDLYIEDTNTIVEIKSIISTDEIAVFPTVYSERTIKQLEILHQELLSGRKACFCIVSLHPYVKEIVIKKDTEFYWKLMTCTDLGMHIHAYTTRLLSSGLIVDNEVPISFEVC